MTVWPVAARQQRRVAILASRVPVPNHPDDGDVRYLRHERMSDSAEGSQHGFECLQAVRMIQGVTLRCVMTVIRDLQDGPDGGVLTDPAVVNLPAHVRADGPALLQGRP